MTTVILGFTGAIVWLPPVFGFIDITLTGSTGLTFKVRRSADPSSDLSIANTKVVVYTPADPRGCLNVAKDFAKFEQNTFNPILRGYVGASSSHPVGINTEAIGFVNLIGVANTAAPNTTISLVSSPVG